MKKELVAYATNGAWALYHVLLASNPFLSSEFFKLKTGACNTFATRLDSLIKETLNNSTHTMKKISLVWSSGLLCTIVSLVSQQDWSLHYIDIKAAYLNNSFHSPIFVRQPPCFIVPSKGDLIYSLDWAIYELCSSTPDSNTFLHT